MLKKIACGFVLGFVPSCFGQVSYQVQFATSGVSGTVTSGPVMGGDFAIIATATARGVESASSTANVAWYAVITAYTETAPTTLTCSLYFTLSPWTGAAADLGESGYSASAEATADYASSSASVTGPGSVSNPDNPPGTPYSNPGLPVTFMGFAGDWVYNSGTLETDSLSASASSRALRVDFGEGTAAVELSGVTGLYAGYTVVEP